MKLEDAKKVLTQLCRDYDEARGRNGQAVQSVYFHEGDRIAVQTLLEAAARPSGLSAFVVGPTKPGEGATLDPTGSTTVTQRG